MRTVLPALVVVAILGCSVGCSLAWADAGPPDDASLPPEGDVVTQAAGVIDRSLAAIKRGDELAHTLVAGAIMLLALGLRRSRKLLPKFFHGDRGGVVLAVLLTALWALGHTALAGASFTSAALWERVFTVSGQAMVLYVAPKKLLWPEPTESAGPPFK
jgi:hypothetical protein